MTPKLKNTRVESKNSILFTIISQIFGNSSISEQIKLARKMGSKKANTTQLQNL